MTVETIIVKGASIRCAMWGKGPRPLVIIPGVSVTRVTDAAKAVRMRYKALLDTHTIILPDRREDLPEGFLAAQMAEDAAGLMDTLSLRDADVFGASQGGLIALLLAARRPDLVRRLAVCSTAARVTPELLRVSGLWRGLAIAGDSRGLTEAFVDNVYSPATLEAYRDALVSGAPEYTPEQMTRFVRQLDACRDMDFRDELEQITCPTLVIGAEGDRVVGADASREIAEILNRAERGSEGPEARRSEHRRAVAMPEEPGEAPQPVARPAAELYIYGEGSGHGVYDEEQDFPERLAEFFGR